MKIQFWAFGKNHDAQLKTAIDDFSIRIRHYFPVEWKIITPPKIQVPEALMKAEAELLKKMIWSGDYVIALDEQGKQFTSVQLARFIEQQSVGSSRNLIFVIGGVYGFHPQFLSRCPLRWSLSKLTFPHQLVRLILAEQVYRACTIMRNEKYHHA